MSLLKPGDTYAQGFTGALQHAHTWGCETEPRLHVHMCQPAQLLLPAHDCLEPTGPEPECSECEPMRTAHKSSKRMAPTDRPHKIDLPQGMLQNCYVPTTGVGHHPELCPFRSTSVCEQALSPRVRRWHGPGVQQSGAVCGFGGPGPCAHQSGGSQPAQ